MKFILLIVICLCCACQKRSDINELQSLNGWREIGEADWKLENGIIEGSKKAEIPTHCLLVTEKAYKNFTIEFDFYSVDGNSGFYFRLAPEKNPLGFKGYHAEIDSQGKNVGGLYDVAVAWMVKPEVSLIANVFKKDDWNHMKIVANEDEIEIYVNGALTTKTQATRSSEGLFGIQLHSNEATHVKFKNMKVKEI